MKDSAIALALMTLNKESYLKTTIALSGSQRQAGGLHCWEDFKSPSVTNCWFHTIATSNFSLKCASQNELLLEQLRSSPHEDEHALLKPSPQMESNV